MGKAKKQLQLDSIVVLICFDHQHMVHLLGTSVTLGIVDVQLFSIAELGHQRVYLRFAAEQASISARIAASLAKRSSSSFRACPNSPRNVQT